MKLRSMKLPTLFQVMLTLSGVLAFAGNTSAQQPPAAGSASVAKTVATVPISPKEFADMKKHLLKAKQVNKWPPKGTIKGQLGQLVVPLSVYECVMLGGKVAVWDCGDSPINLKCIGSNGKEMCITTLQ